MPQGAPPQDETLRDALRQLDPRLEIVNEVWYGHFEGDASSEQLIRYLTKHGYQWAKVSRATMCRWMHRIEAIRCNIL